MPRRRDLEKARTVQLTLSVRPGEARQWRDEARSRGISLSRLLYARVQVGTPLPSPGSLAMAGELGRIGNNLNQLIKLLHGHGLCLDLDRVSETLQVVWEVQKRLVNP